jgi:hypothetical protein
MSKTNEQAEANGSQPFAAAAGSAPAGCPPNVIRMVLQMEDTPANRQLMLQAYVYAERSLQSAGGRHGVLKREEVLIAGSHVKQAPNDQAQPRQD